ncbi:MAG: triose-phosphate isomerase, partial [Candidatus Hydromicrobium americanum]
SKTKPDSVRDFADAIKKINPEIGVLCGAGISNGSDVKAALELGCVGVLAATAVTEADDPKQILLDMCSQA